ncbi:unnamed protein product [Adineta steineri]|uniref:Uncharacterized protein n=1 Tax=Adineta steineri TaxID=433720 RepID=A0A818S9T5_9BILA|nr:unnamed protein product [Adineta steineri]CAF3663081.1 unnamed protein product [Adineta steineri]
MENTTMILNNTMNISTSTLNMTVHQNLTTIVTSKKPLFIQGQELINERINKMDRGTLIWSTAALVAFTCIILMYIGIRTFMLRKRRQTRRYKLLSNATTMEEPLFNDHDEEEEKDDDTLFVRK